MSQSSTAVPEKGSVISSAQMAAHEGLVRWVVRQQWRGGLSFPDALHAGRIGLWQALQHYDPRRGTQFSSYAVPAIARAVWRAVADDQRTRGAAPEGPAPSLAPPDGVEELHRLHVQSALRTLVAHLPPRLHHVIVAHHGLGADPPQSFAAIGARLGLTRQRVQQLHVEALLWLAHPAHSQELRQLLARHTRRDYQRTLARQHRRARLRRAPRRSSQTRRGAGRRIKP